jgi:chloride channel protein, CIC family
MYGVGYPVMDKAIAGNYVLWFLIVLAAGKIIACSMALGIGGSGGVFAPSLFIGVTSGMAFGEIADHLLGPGAGQPALYAVVAMGAVFTSAPRAPLTSLASVVEMTGDFTLTLPVMLAVAIATATSRALSYGTIYTTKLLRRGQDIDRAAPWRAFGDLKAAGVMRPFPEPLAIAPGPDGDGCAAPALARLAGPVTYQGDPQTVLATESLAQALRQVAAYGRDGLPVLSGDGQQVQGWITGASVLDTVAREISGPQAAAGGAQPDGQSSRQEPPNPLHGWQVLEVTIEDGSPASGQALGAITWPPGILPVSVLRNRRLQDAEPGLTLTPGDRINLLARAPQSSLPPLAQDMPGSDQDGQRPRIPGAH